MRLISAGGISTHLVSSFRSKCSDVIDSDFISPIAQIKIRSLAEEREKIWKQYYTPYFSMNHMTISFAIQ